MVIALLIVGILLTTSGIRGTEGQLASQFASDMTGTDGFIVWLGALLVIGLIGFVPGLQRPSRYLLALIILVIVLRNGGVFTNLVAAFAQADATGAAPAPPLPANSNSSSSGSAGNNVASDVSAVGGIGSLFSGIAALF